MSYIHYRLKQLYTIDIHKSAATTHLLSISGEENWNIVANVTTPLAHYRKEVSFENS